VRPSICLVATAAEPAIFGIMIHITNCKSRINYSTRNFGLDALASDVNHEPIQPNL
jgi:hypothetical protein